MRAVSKNAGVYYYVPEGTNLVQIEREIQAAVDEALEEAAKVAHAYIAGSAYALVIENDIRLLKSKPAPHADAIRPKETLSDDPVMNHERELIAEWLWKYANEDKWRSAATTDEIRHFVGHAMDYIKGGWYRDAAEEGDAVSQRPETGPMQFPDDWCGIFIRGDNALAYACYVDSVLAQVKDGQIRVHGLKGLSTLLHSCRQDIAKDVQQASLVEAAPVIRHGENCPKVEHCIGVLGRC